jgi:hypothetical protein
VKRLWDAFHKPFSSKQAKKRREERERQSTEDVHHGVMGGENDPVVTCHGTEIQSELQRSENSGSHVCDETNA